MHPGALAARRADAEARIELAAALLAEQAGIELNEERASARDTAVSDLYRLEYVADLLERLAASPPDPGQAVPPPHVGSGPEEFPQLAGNVREVSEWVETVTDQTTLVRAAYLEAEGKGRKGVLDAIQAHIDALAGGTQ